MQFLGLEYDRRHVDVLAGETRTPEFMEKNRNAKIPLLEIDDSVYLSESNAILNYLAEGTTYLTDSGLPPESLEEYESKQTGGYKALSVMEHQLNKTPYLIGDSPTIADISLYAYTHVCHEGGFALSEYSSISAWLQRIEALPGYIGMPEENRQSTS
jgi:glutathione S-transferase